MASSNVPSLGKILITGVTGYIGFQTLEQTLSRGYQARAVVRRENNIAELCEKSSLIAQSHGNQALEFVVIKDFLNEAMVRDALHGITQTDDYDSEIVQPAIETVATLLGACRHVETITRVVITSSCVTLFPFEWNMDPDSERLYTADDINSSPSRPFHSSMEAYWASKALARLATREFVRQKKPSFDTVSLLPSVVIGRDNRISSKGPVSSLVQETRAAVLAPALDASLNSSFPFVGVPVHVKDVARAHVDALDTGRIPGNTEFILSSDGPDGVVWDRDIADIARKHFPDSVEDGSLPLQGSLKSIRLRLETSRTEEAFGWKFTSFEETMKGLLSQYLELKDNQGSN